MKTFIIDTKLKFFWIVNNISIGRTGKDSRKFLCKNQLDLIIITRETAISKSCVQLNAAHVKAYPLPYIQGHLGIRAHAFMLSAGSVRFIINKWIKQKVLKKRLKAATAMTKARIEAKTNH